jgi:hypothetical protein
MEIQEIENRIKEGGLKFCCLYKKNKQIECYNNVKQDVFNKLEQIKKRLILQPTGEYEIRCKNSVKGGEDILYLDWINNENKITTMSEEINPKFLENKAYMELAIKNAELLKDQEINSLKNEISNLELEIEELNEKLTEKQITPLSEEKTPSLMENAKEFLSTLMEFGAPLLDQHFEIKKQELQLQALKLGKNLKREVRQDNNEQQRKKQREQELIKITENWINSKNTDNDENNEEYLDLQNLYNSSKNLKEFLDTLTSNNIELYEELCEQF